ncbi:MAG TPA: phosphatase, partial [Actinomycetota bacterium]|nr:phosphatase [Actinomycetota bacterium]
MSESKAQPTALRRSDDRWVRGEYTDDELTAALLANGMAGEVSHDRANVWGKVQRLVTGDPDVTFGLSGMTRYEAREVIGLVARAIDFAVEPNFLDGPTVIEPATILQALHEAGDRLALAADRGEEVLIATGHPVGMVMLYIEVARELSRRGAKLLRPLEGFRWRELGRSRQIRYLHGVGVLTDRASSLHTHSPGPMERMLGEVEPD